MLSWESQLRQIRKIHSMAHIFGLVKYGRVGYPCKDHQKCSSADALTLSIAPPSQKSRQNQFLVQFPYCNYNEKTENLWEIFVYGSFNLILLWLFYTWLRSSGTKNSNFKKYWDTPFVESTLLTRNLGLAFAIRLFGNNLVQNLSTSMPFVKHPLWNQEPGTILTLNGCSQSKVYVFSGCYLWYSWKNWWSRHHEIPFKDKRKHKS